MIAAELAFRLGADLQLTSIDDIWDEISEISVLHQGITVAQLAAETDGIVLRPSGPAPETEADIEANGVDAETVADADAQDHAVAADAAADVDEAEAHEAAAAEAQADAEAAAGPSFIGFVGTTYEAPAVDAYSLRLVTYRKLFDLGTMVQAAPSLAGLAAGAAIAANPTDLDRLGVGPADRVKLSSARGSITATITPDASVPVGTVAMAIDQGDPSPTALIDASSAVTEIRVETIA
jgi:anaerobic selenocysteine-containing dehydrogenase